MPDDIQLTAVNQNLAYISQQIDGLERSIASVASAVRELLAELKDQHRTLVDIVKAVERQ